MEPGEVKKVGDGFDEENSEVKIGKIEKMSKSKKNVIDPSEIINLYGADTARWFMLSDSPPDRDLQWTETGIASSYKFINKIWDLLSRYKNYTLKTKTDESLLDKFRLLTNEVSQNIEDFQFNKSIAKIYEYVNLLSDSLTKDILNKDDFNWSLKRLAILLQPFIPHISEEIWSNL